MTEETAVLFMAYGTPESIDEVEPYFTHIRGGLRPSEEELQSLRARYTAVGGRTPLVEITERQAKGAESLLNARRHPVRAYVGMKHWHPFVKDAVSEIVRTGHREIVAVPLAPFYSAVSTEGYRNAVDEAVPEENVKVTFVPAWHDDSKLFASWLAILKESLAANPLGPRGHLLFTAHSLPRTSMPPGDPYESQLRGLATRLASAARVSSWSFAFQSVGLVGGEWLGPVVHDVVEKLAASGVRDLLVAPLGFVSENLETLYDLDKDLAAYAGKRGLAFRRAPAPNARPDFVDALAHVVEANL